jgi:hypothetical protein
VIAKQKSSKIVCEGRPILGFTVRNSKRSTSPSQYL